MLDLTVTSSLWILKSPSDVKRLERSDAVEQLERRNGLIPVGWLWRGLNLSDPCK